MRQSTGKPVESQTTWEYSYPDEAGVGGGEKVALCSRNAKIPDHGC